MAHRVEVAFRPELETADAPGRVVRERVRVGFDLDVERVRTVDVYTLDAELAPSELKRIAEELLHDPVVQLYSVDPEEWRSSRWTAPMKSWRR